MSSVHPLSLTTLMSVKHHVEGYDSRVFAKAWNVLTVSIRAKIVDVFFLCNMREGQDKRRIVWVGIGYRVMIYFV